MLVLMLDALPDAKSMSGDRGYDSDWFRKALIEKGIEPCIPQSQRRPAGDPAALNVLQLRRRTQLQPHFTLMPRMRALRLAAAAR